MVLLNVAASRVNHRLSRRAVLAHELCHLLHDGGEANLVTLVTREEDREAIEKRANAFAPGFIAPRKWTRATTSAATPIERVREIARTWGLTFEGAAWHAKNSELIEPEVAEELVKRHETIASDCEPTLSRRDPATVGLDVASTPLVGGLAQDMVVEAYAEGLISRGRARELLTLKWVLPATRAPREIPRRRVGVAGGGAPRHQGSGARGTRIQQLLQPEAAGHGDRRWRALHRCS